MVKGGIILGKRYEVLSKIGAGGMADVYKGRDTILNRYVAIKVLKKEYREDENFVRKFHSEAQAAAGLQNPNIVDVYDVGEDRGLLYMVMELVEGITLKEYIKRKGRLSHKEIISIAIQLCTGIGAAHAANIIHRDIKPQNIIISKDGKVKVTDFGIAKATTSNTISSNAMGSVHYTSPEQARGGFSDAKSDIYSIGITLFEMTTGHVPFDGDSTVSVAIKHLQEEITPPSELVDDVPYSLDQIILKCTQKNSERRYANTNELIRDLKRSLVDPDGDFVVIPPLRNADTVIITDEELDDIRSSYDDDDDEYDDGYGDEQYTEEYTDSLDGYDDEDYDTDGKRGRKKDSDDVNPRMKKVMRILTIVVAIIIVFIVVFAVGKAAGVFKSLGQGTVAEETTDEVKVPNVVGMTVDEAQTELKKKHLGIKKVGEEESEKYEKGQIISQTPANGEKAKKNTTVEVVISSGLVEEKVEVPDVSGMDEESAQKALENEGFTVGTSEFVYSDSYDEGEVIETDPAAGEKVSKDTEVIMTVCKGSEKVTVPDVVGKKDADAQSAIKSAGLKVSKVTYEYDDDVAKGKVISQSESAGKKVSPGTGVEIVVSNGKKPEEKVSVPNLGGKTYQQAKALLESYGLVAVNGGEEESEEDIGKVSRWSPAGSKVTKGTKVTVWISRGYDEPDEPDDDNPTNNNNTNNPTNNGTQN